MFAAAPTVTNMTVVIPDAQAEWGFPDIGVKPTGQFVLDSDHELYPHVLRAFIPSHGIALDTIDGVLTPTGNAKIDSVNNAEFDGGTSKFTYSNSTPVSSEITIVTRIRRHSAGHSEGIYSDQDKLTNWGSSEGIVFIMMSNSSAAALYVAGTSTYDSSSTSIPLNTWIDVVASWKASTWQKFWLNGVEPSYTANNVASSYTLSTVNSVIGTYYDGTSSRTFDGEIEYLYVFNTAFNKAEGDRFRADPYQMLIPA